jgi:epithelial splicing regulatory protein 1/2
MDGENSAFNTSNHKHNKYIFFAGKKYFIEVLQCSGEEMNLVLMGVVPSNLLNASVPKTTSITSLSRNNTPMNAPPPVPPAFTNFSPIIPNNQAILSTASTTTVQSQPALFTHIPVTTSNTATPMPQITASTSVSSNTSAAQFYPTQILYWYPTPPVSPTSAIYIHPSTTFMQTSSSPSIIVLRGVPQNVTIGDLMKFLSGYPEVN